MAPAPTVPRMRSPQCQVQSRGPWDSSGIANCKTDACMRFCRCTQATILSSHVHARWRASLVGCPPICWDKLLEGSQQLPVSPKPRNQDNCWILPHWQLECSLVADPAVLDIRVHTVNLNMGGRMQRTHSNLAPSPRPTLTRDPLRGLSFIFIFFPG